MESADDTPGWDSQEVEGTLEDGICKRLKSDF
jgi:hypothetical protein